MGPTVTPVVEELGLRVEDLGFRVEDVCLGLSI